MAVKQVEDGKVVNSFALNIGVPVPAVGQCNSEPTHRRDHVGHGLSFGSCAELSTFHAIVMLGTVCNEQRSGTQIICFNFVWSVKLFTFHSKLTDIFFQGL